MLVEARGAQELSSHRGTWTWGVCLVYMIVVAISFTSFVSHSHSLYNEQTYGCTCFQFYLDIANDVKLF